MTDLKESILIFRNHLPSESELRYVVSSCNRRWCEMTVWQHHKALHCSSS